jgi:plastocyanin
MAKYDPFAVRRNPFVLILGIAVLTASACRTRPEAERSYRPSATIKDIMTSIIDPEADVLWNSVAVIISASGTEEREPKTDEEWAMVRRSAIQLVEATNLLRIPGRQVAKPGEKSENPRIELEPETMQKLIADDPVTWTRMIDGLHDAAMPALNAINSKNAKGLFDAGEHLERACESCHQHYWYPPKEAPAWKLEPPAVGTDTSVTSVPPVKGGAIRGHIRVNGKLPGNPVIRMGMDPMCAKLNAGKQPVQEIVAATADGSLANVFVKLEGSFPSSPVPATPVTIDQRACIYLPRVVGARVGQVLQVRNSDALLHNVHGLSKSSNAFNVGQPVAGAVTQFQLKQEEIMLRVSCDIHRWMTAYVGVVSHPYFATSGAAGTYAIENVPPGTYSIQAWHEQYGVRTEKVSVTAGASSTIDFAY